MSDLRIEYERIVRPLEDRMICSIWRIVRHPADADDVLQNALTTIWRHWARVMKHPNPEVLIIKICLDASYDLLRRRAHEQRHVQNMPVQSEVERTLSPDAELHRYEIYAEVTAAIGGLPRNGAGHATADCPKPVV